MVYLSGSGNCFPSFFHAAIKSLIYRIMRKLRINALHCSFLSNEVDERRAAARTEITRVVFLSVSDSDRDQEDSHVFSQTRDPAVSQHRSLSSCRYTNQRGNLVI